MAGDIGADLDHYFSGFLKVDPVLGDRAMCPTGERYIVITLDGAKPEGEMSQVFATSERAALSLLFLRLKEYGEGKSGTVYWRTRPEVDCSTAYLPDVCSEPVFDNQNRPNFTLRPRNLWQGYARILISDKPVLADHGSD
jgi:hypothetical protein